MKGAVFTTCQSCNRGFNLANPLVELTETGARCPHCGQITEAEERQMEEARCDRNGGGCCG